MDVITRTEDLEAACARLAQAPYVAIDTEFMRDVTYWPKLCLIQVANPDEEMIIDPLAEGLVLDAFIGLLEDRNVIKVFHAGRQDIEIFYHHSETIPDPLFDTQVAAMVCGFGESASYETLVKRLANASIDKSSRLTDWSRRPLTEKQLTYAIGDVTHLRTVYEKLSQEIQSRNRVSWVAEEMGILQNPETYALRPEDAWRRLKSRSIKPKGLAILREVAAWREREAQRKNVPRNRVLKDDALYEITNQMPSTLEALENSRTIPRGFSRSSGAKDLLHAVKVGKNTPADQIPKPARSAQLPNGSGPLLDLLKVLLKAKCSEAEVAQKLVATTQDLEWIASDDQATVAALKGWRHEVFGADALRLKHGDVALTVGNRHVRLVPLSQTKAP